MHTHPLRGGNYYQAMHTVWRVGFVVLLTAVVAACDREPPFWSEEQKHLLQSLSLEQLPSLPASPSNRVADNPAAIELGRQLFFDTRLSGDNTRSCASCHQPKRQFTDGLPTGVGVKTLSRNTPSLIGGGWQSWFYWDGRRDSLWSQALIPIEAPDEMGGSRVGTVRLVLSDPKYRTQYTALFGPAPRSLVPAQLPEHAGEFASSQGKNAWHQLSPSTQHAVNTAYANIGKAIAAFERTLAPQATAFDHYVTALVQQGESAAEPWLSPAAIRGAKLFIDVTQTRCLQCHNGPMLTNGDFHNVGTDALENTNGAPLDLGRLMGVQAVLLDQFNCLGLYSDAEPDQCTALRFLSKEVHGDTAGAYKTPSLRHAGQTGPYFHDGQSATLKEVMRHYNSPPDSDHELTPLEMSDAQLDDLVAFIESLNAPIESSTAPLEKTQEIHQRKPVGLNRTDLPD